MSAFDTISEFGHLARRFSARQVERIQDWYWFATRRALPMVLLKDQEPLDGGQLERADEIIDWIEEIVEARPAYIEQHGLDPAVHFPQAVWALDDGHGLYDGFRAVASRDPRVLNNLRLWSQQFTGYRLLTMEPASCRPFPSVEEIGPDADQRLAKMSARPDRWVGRYLRIASRLPTDFRVSPPRQLGEIGWNCDGRTVSFDTYTYLERLAVLHDCGLIEKLRTIASEGCTPCIVEIGGGFGGLSYYLSQLVPQVRIIIVDIPESLIFSSLYLSLLLPEREQVYARPDMTDETLVPSTPGCTFVPNYLFDAVIGSHVDFDLAINTLSMSEMDESQVEYYCQGLNQSLATDGVFFEQNHDNKPVGRLNAKKIIARHFGRRQEVHSRAARALTQGRTHLWSRDPRVARAEITVSPSQISNIRRSETRATSSVGNS
jgi:putative sugar O-methyltransferase